MSYESDYPDDLDIRFRLAVGRAVAQTNNFPSLADLGLGFRPCSRPLSTAQDRLAASCFLAIGAAMWR